MTVSFGLTDEALGLLGAMSTRRHESLVRRLLLERGVPVREGTQPGAALPPLL
ncbi:hypothetical protein ACFYSJ_38735 [Streptomyces sp. NPDC005248]|uniref:hypothetical protein n=1 Tax=Streptomyces sp. NPDC005248 TaxID=3364709 RepID=UPI0036B04390